MKDFAMLLFRFFSFFWVLVSVLGASPAAAFDFKTLSAPTPSNTTVVRTEQLSAELLVHAPDGVAAGKTIWLGLQLTHQPHWHTYWKNPGDSGLATELQWTLPAGIRAGDIRWPSPQKIAVGNLVNFGYEGTVLLAMPLTIDAQFSPDPVTNTVPIELAASWLVCRQECIPQEGRFTLRIPMQRAITQHQGIFDAAQAASPVALEGLAQTQVSANGVTLFVSGLPSAWQGKAIYAFPETDNLIDNPGAPAATDAVESGIANRPGTQGWKEGVWSAHVAFSPQRNTNPSNIKWVLTHGTQSLLASSSVDGTWPASPPPAQVSAALQEALARNAQSTASPSGSALQYSTYLWALATALLGGLILNLMPCVFPILAIKMLQFSQHHDSPASQRLQGVAYVAGVVVSFLVLGGVLLSLRAAGEQLGWGFQLQSPGVIAALAVLFTLLGLNLLGALELGHWFPSSLAGIQLQHPVSNAFFSGVLAVAVASPCTAPFMGASLGYAITLPNAQALGVFAALGLGLALPYGLAGWVPAISRYLPRPGAWMEQLRRCMAFPMWATVVWLLWVLGHLGGIDAASSLLALLLCLAWLAWSLRQSGWARWVFVGISLSVGGFLTNTLGPNVLNVSAATSAQENPAAQWQTWSPQRVAAAQAAGQAVFVDFTAAWCITCQYNKKTTLSNPLVLADFKAKNVLLLRADWTRRDPAITQALEALGRSGVPVYVLHRAGAAPHVFSEILNADDLRATLATL